MKLNYDFFLNKFNSAYNNDIRLVDLSNKWWYHNCRVHFAGNQKHSFHIVTRSPWPLYSSIAALMFTFGMVMHMHNYFYGNLLSLAGFFLILLMMFVWWRDVIRESTFSGYHTKKVQQGLRLGVILFIISEVMFFFSFFWAFFHASLSPSVVLGSVWPPLGINVLNPLKIPLLNTLILLLSGLTVTWSHHVIRDKSWQKFFFSNVDNEEFKTPLLDNYVICAFVLFLTIFLGLEFTVWQGYEYYKASFYIYDGVYGSTFYMTTGLHGLHVIIGTLFLIVCFFRLVDLHFIYNHHFGYEAAIWYWHFVDVVWIFLFLSIYCWGSGVDSFFK
jgi:heme/copper-type cytochrome/quinol oxidase subunit 3